MKEEVLPCKMLISVVCTLTVNLPKFSLMHTLWSECTKQIIPVALSVKLYHDDNRLFSVEWKYLAVAAIKKAI